MGYVQVPVPEELVREVMEFVLDRSKPALAESWTLEAAGVFYDETDPAGRELLDLLAKGKSVSMTKAAEHLAVSRSALAGIVGAMSRRAKNHYTSSSPIRSFSRRVVSEDDGPTMVRSLRMDPDTAEVFRAAKRAAAAD